ncbi:protein phosphatase 1 regulatory subunit 1C isoform X2 [Anguilla rostrata]|uniref:protein phosphatase 1 regulatory subunit 1C isoform X2 n=1 Tax=Anguilla rostrata TaxID=7938 RepID=UPI0030CB416C
MEPNSPKKIQFAMPLFHSHLDPQAAENIRRRRPTPATLVIYNDSPGAADDKRTSGSQGEVPNTDLSPAQRKQSVYTPPTMKELQLVVEQHLQKQENLDVGLCESLDPLSPITAQHYGNAAQWANHNCPEPNGNEAHVNLLLGTEEHPDSCTGGREWAEVHGARDERGGDRRTPHSQPHSDRCSETRSGNPPRRKDTPYQHSHPFNPGTKLLRTQRESFPEEEEGVEEQEKDTNP